MPAYSAALEYSMLIKEPQARIEALISLVRSLAATDDSAMLQEAADRALEAIRTYEQEALRPPKAQIMGWQAQLAEANVSGMKGSPSILNSLVTSSRLLPAESRGPCLAEVAACYARMHYFRRARQLVKEIRKCGDGSGLHLARALAWCGELEDAALTLARCVINAATISIQTPNPSFREIADVAAIYFFHGAADAGNELLRAALPLISEWGRGEDLTLLTSRCCDLIKSGNGRSALDLLQRHAETRDYAGACEQEFLKLAESAVVSRQYDTAIEGIALFLGALDATASGSSDEWRVRQIARVAQICLALTSQRPHSARQVLKGLIERAVAVDGADERAYALAFLAVAHARAGAPEEGKVLLGQAMMAGLNTPQVAAARLGAYSTAYALVADDYQDNPQLTIDWIVQDLVANRFRVFAVDRTEADGLSAIVRGITARHGPGAGHRLIDQVLAYARRIGPDKYQNALFLAARPMAEIGTLDDVCGILEQIQTEDRFTNIPMSRAWARAAAIGGFIAVGNLSWAREMLRVLREETSHFPFELDRAAAFAHAARLMHEAGASEDAEALMNEVLALETVQRAINMKANNNVIGEWQSLTGLWYDPDDGNGQPENSRHNDSPRITRTGGVRPAQLRKAAEMGDFSVFFAAIGEVIQDRAEKNGAYDREAKEEFEHRNSVEIQQRRQGWRMHGIAWDLVQVTAEPRLSNASRWARVLNSDAPDSTAIVEAYMGNLSQALRAAQESRSNPWGTGPDGSSNGDKQIAEVCSIIARKGEPIDARQAISSIVDPVLRWRTQAELAFTVAQSGEFEEAGTLARATLNEADGIQDYHQQAIGLAHIAATFGVIGNTEQALGVFRSAIKSGRSSGTAALFDVFTYSVPGLEIVRPNLAKRMCSIIEQSAQLSLLQVDYEVSSG